MTEAPPPTPVVPQQPPEQAQVPAGQPKPPGLAIASLICGIAGFPLIFACFTGIPVGIVGAILGHVASKKIRESRGVLGGAGMAKAGMICGYISAALGVILLIVYVAFIGFVVSQGEFEMPVE